MVLNLYLRRKIDFATVHLTNEQHHIRECQCPSSWILYFIWPTDPTRRDPGPPKNIPSHNVPELERATGMKVAPVKMKRLPLREVTAVSFATFYLQLPGVVAQQHGDSIVEGKCCHLSALLG